MKNNNIYSEVTNLIIEEIETNQALPWVRDWDSQGGGFPRNAISKRNYNGINVLILWIIASQKGYSSREWITFKQGKDAGYQVRKGEKGTRIVFYKTLKIEDKATKEEAKIPMIKAFTVFNIDQFEGVESQETQSKRENEELVLPGEFISNIKHDLAVGNPCYIPSLDQIRMPNINAFKHSGGYYSNYFHELTHWTGHESRLERVKHKELADDVYKFEELIAELGSAFLCSELMVTGDNRHAGYIEHWLKLLKDDSKAIFRAAARANKACELLHSYQ